MSRPLPLALGIGLLVGLFAVWRALPWAVLIEGVPHPSGDLAQALSGALAYARDGWRFPLFDVEGASGLGRQNVIYTDAVPGLALLYKLLGAEPATIERTFVTVFIGAALVAQGMAGALAAHMLGLRHPLAIAGAALTLVCWPLFLFRISVMEHLALTGHAPLILAAALLVKPYRRGSVHLWAWVLLAAVALLVHPYHFVLVTSMFLARMGMEVVAPDRALPLGRLVIAGAIFLGVSLALMALFGHVGGARPDTPTRYSSYYAMNLAAPAIPAWTSLVVPDWSPFPLGQIEGYAYLGLAGFALMIAALMTIAAGRPRGMEPAPASLGTARTLVLTLFCALVVLYAVGEHWYVADRHLFDIGMPGIVEAIGASFRAHGRFVWIASYVAILLAIALVGRRLGTAGAFGLLAAGLIAQVETTPLQARVVPTTSALVSDPLVNEIVAASSKVSVYPPFACEGSTGIAHHAMQLLAIRHGAGLANDFVSGRADPDACAAAPLAEVADGVDPGETAVVFLDDARLNRLLASPQALDQCRTRGALALCHADWSGIAGAKALPVIAIESFSLPLDIAFERGRDDVRALIEGFSEAEGWGTWSVGTRSRIHLPLDAPATLRRAVLDIGGFLPPGRAPYAATVTLGWEGRAGQGEAARRVVFTPGTDERHTVEIVPDTPVEGVETVEIEIAVADPLSPREAGIGDDARRLGVSVTRLRMD